MEINGKNPPLDKRGGSGYNEHSESRRFVDPGKRLAQLSIVKQKCARNNRHFAEWRLSLLSVTVTVIPQTWNVKVMGINLPPFGASQPPAAAGFPRWDPPPQNSDILYSFRRKMSRTPGLLPGGPSVRGLTRAAESCIIVISNIGGQVMATEKEMKAYQQATIYEIRRLLKNSGKESYKTEELLDLLDTIADAKDQEA